MNTAVSHVSHPGSTAGAAELTFERGAVSGIRLAAYLELAKPRIALMVVLSAAAGFILGSRGIWQPLPLMNASIGILLAVVSSSAFNQWYERETDARMPRTQDRPLPSFRLSVAEVFVFALITGVASVSYLAVTVNFLTAGLAASSIVLYAGCYTPLKRYTTFCTVVGAIPGALPPVLGWTASGAELNLAAFSLFAILFVWQFPHFLAIAWLYRDQYEQAGLKMVPGHGRPGINGAIAASYALVLIPISLLPVQLGLTGDLYGLAAMVLGGIYAWTAIRFQRSETRRRARHVVWASLVYLPAVLCVLTLDHLRLIN
jgi:protoheme IX farnesyltransferase